VITFASVPLILARGAAFYRDYGMGRSRGTLPIQLAGNIKHGGLVEKAFGVTLRELVFDFGGGTASGRPVKAVQVGGPLGAYVPESQWDMPLDYEAYAAVGAVVGHGGIVVHDDTADMAQLARYAMEFCAIESCGKCTPCRIGSTRGVEVIDRIRRRPATAQQVRLLRDLCDTMVHGSLCAMGGMTPFPVLSALNHYPAGLRPRRDSPTARRHDHACTQEPPCLTHLSSPDHGTPRRESARVRHAGDRRRKGHRARRHLAHARRHGRRHPGAQALRHRQPGALWLLPPVPGGDRGPQGLPGVVHHTGRGRHEGAHPDAAPAGLRKGVMELYISDHPLDCLTCAPTATASCRTWPA
jgi:hypothetical protein